MNEKTDFRQRKIGTNAKILKNSFQGRIQDFHLGEGGAKDYARARTSQLEVPYGQV